MKNEKQKFLETLALNIRVERTRKKYTQDKLAELCDISVKHLTKIENAQVTTNIYYIYKIAKTLDVTIDELTKEYKNSLYI